MRKTIGIALCCVLPMFFAVVLVGQDLDRRGILNNKDLPPFVGDEDGTLSEYVFNVWHWDAAALLLMLAALPALALGAWLLLVPGRPPTNEVA